MINSYCSRTSFFIKKTQISLLTVRGSGSAPWSIQWILHSETHGAHTVRSVRACHTPTALCLPFPISCNLMKWWALSYIPSSPNSLSRHYSSDFFNCTSLSPLSLSSFDSPTCGRHCQMPIPSLSISLYHHPCLYSTTSRIASSSLSSSYACNLSSPLSLSTWCTSGLCGQSHTLKRKPPHVKNDMPLMT
jgi:hypothetical protein